MFQANFDLNTVGTITYIYENPKKYQKIISQRAKAVSDKFTRGAAIEAEGRVPDVNRIYADNFAVSAAKIKPLAGPTAIQVPERFSPLVRFHFSCIDVSRVLKGRFWRAALELLNSILKYEIQRHIDEAAMKSQLGACSLVVAELQKQSLADLLSKRNVLTKPTPPPGVLLVRCKFPVVLAWRRTSHRNLAWDGSQQPKP